MIISGIRTEITKYTVMTGQSIVQALPFLTSTEQVITQDQTEYDNAKSKKVVA